MRWSPPVVVCIKGCTKVDFAIVCSLSYLILQALSILKIQELQSCGADFFIKSMMKGRDTPLSEPSSDVSVVTMGAHRPITSHLSKHVGQSQVASPREAACDWSTSAHRHRADATAVLCPRLSSAEKSARKVMCPDLSLRQNFVL